MFVRLFLFIAEFFGTENKGYSTLYIFIYLFITQHMLLHSKTVPSVLVKGVSFTESFNLYSMPVFRWWLM